MKKQDALFVLSLAVFWGGLYFTLTSQKRIAPTVSVIDPAVTISRSPTDTSQLPPPNMSQPAVLTNISETKVPLGPTPLPKPLPPSLQQLQEEVRLNAHMAPLSLLTFSDAVSEWLPPAESNFALAETLMAYMETCLTESEPVAIQAYCFETAGHLSKFHQGRLKARLTSLSQKVRPQTRRLLKLYKSLNLPPS